MIRQYLSQPYPLYERSWKMTLVVSLFISFFMVFFEPFGLSSFTSKYRSFIEIGYGLVTFLVLLFNFFLVPFLFKKEYRDQKWTVIKQIVWHVWNLFCIGFINYLYSSFFLHFSNNLQAFLYFQFYTLLVGIIPIVIITINNQNRLLAENLKIANEYNNGFVAKTNSLSVEEKVCLIADNNKDKLEVNSSDLIYITSTGNYIQVFYQKDNDLKNSLLRNTLKQTEDQLKDNHSVIKCHRAYLVNKNKIVRVKGNSQGLRLVLSGTDEEIPVSRKLSKNLMDLINA
jgi:hypothetical protein